MMLQKIWIELLSKYNCDPQLALDLWNELTENYSKQGRSYHNLNHLGYMFQKAKEQEQSIEDFDTLCFSIFYHDIIYEIQKQDNEEKSAEIAVNRMKKIGVPFHQIQKCYQQIIATKAHRSTGDPDTDYLLDFDLAIIGDTPQKYGEYAEKVRVEYSQYDDEIYNAGRKKVLQHFLNMPQIFKTDFFHKKYEIQARKNLEVELESYE